jgi:voltage-gated potassium channel
MEVTAVPRPENRYPSLAAKAPRFAAASAGVGVALIVAGVLATVHPLPGPYRTSFSGYDTPFDIVAGMILLALSNRLRRRSSIAWLFSIPVPVLAGAIAILSPDPYSILATVLSAALLAVIFPYRSGFYLGSPTGPEATQLILIVASLAAVLFGMVGARWLGSQFLPPVRTWGEALYFTVAMISTIGSNYVPVTDTARWFAVALVLVGVGTFLSAIVVLFVPFLQHRIATVGGRFERAQMQ